MTSGPGRRDHSRATRLALLGLASAALGAGACHVTTNVGVLNRDAGTGADRTQPPLCAEQIEPTVIRPGSSGAPTCTPRLAASTFTFALCSCGDLQVRAGFSTDSFDSSRGPYTPDQEITGGGPVGVDGAMSVENGADIKGTLIVSDTGTLFIGANQIINGDLKVNGDLVVGGSAVVRRNAWLRGRIDVDDGLIILGDLYRPWGTNTPSSVQVSEDIHRTDVEIARACPCSESDRLDIPALISAAADTNDNASIGLSPAAFDDTAPRQPVRLPCGSFFLDRVSGTGNATIIVEGRTALYVAGDMHAWDGLAIVLGPRAELDIFVGGALVVETGAAIGDPTRASSLRFYVADNLVDFGRTIRFSGNLYAPNATALAREPIEIFGSLLVGALVTGAEVAIHYDRSVLGAGSDCTLPPSETCSRCGDCSDGLACVSGTCGPCTVDSDCCDPLVCDRLSGRCEQLVF